jgi:hypothetical protein
MYKNNMLHDASFLQVVVGRGDDIWVSLQHLKPSHYLPFSANCIEIWPWNAVSS